MTRTVKGVAKHLGLPERTVRYYDTVALVSPSRRSRAGYRLYDGGDEEKLAFVRQARRLGYSLDEIRSLIAAAEAVSRGRREPRPARLLDEKIAEIDVRAAELAAVRERLVAYRSGRGSACGCRGHRAFCSCREQASKQEGGDSMCGCCTPSRKDEKSTVEARAEREDEPKTIEQRVAELEKKLEPAGPR